MTVMIVFHELDERNELPVLTAAIKETLIPAFEKAAGFLTQNLLVYFAL